MNQTTTNKLRANAKFLKDYHRNNGDRSLLDEPFRLALYVLDHPGLSHKDVADKIGCHWDTVRQIRSALNV
jgi:hypothetical protein